MTQMSLYRESSERWQPHPYQTKAMKFVLERSQAALFLDPGLGKTSVSLGALTVLLGKKLTRGALVIAPLRVCYSVWPREARKWTDFHHLEVVLLHGKGKEANLKKKADVYVINPEGLDWLCKDGKIQSLLAKGIDTLIVDELSKFKHSKTKRFKLIKPWLVKFKRRYGLTGSPASNGLLDLFGQCFMLDLGTSLGRYITHYKMQYFYPSGFNGYTWLPRVGASDEIYEKLKPLALRMDAKDYLDLPQLVNNIIKVELPAPARKVYNEMEELAFSQIDANDLVTAASAAAATNKCRQIANGGVYTDGVVGEAVNVKRAVRELHGAKVEALMDLVEELQGAPLLVAYEFQHDLARVGAAMPGVPYIGGGTTTKAAAELEARWNRGELPVLLGHPQSIGHGLNLQGQNAYNVCWFGLTWDYELYDQFIKRVLRQGNKAARVMVHHIVAEGTVDEAVLKSLRNKKRTQGALLDALNDYRGKSPRRRV